MISDFKQIETLFEVVDHHLNTKVNVYVIGGVALLYQGLKPATKDIDLIILGMVKNILPIFSSFLQEHSFIV
jgi:hypothetical protein